MDRGMIFAYLPLVGRASDSLIVLFLGLSFPQKHYLWGDFGLQWKGKVTKSNSANRSLLPVEIASGSKPMDIQLQGTCATEFSPGLHIKQNEVAKWTVTTSKYN